MNMIGKQKQSTEIQQEEQLFKVLSHPARLAILDELRRDEACVCHLEAKLGVPAGLYIAAVIRITRCRF